jgi:Lipopolysaccharide assembly protein A domain
MNVAVLGLILLAAAGVLTAAVVTSNTGAVDVDLWGTTISNLSLGAVFVAGMLTTAIAVVGLAVLMTGLRRDQRLRRERRVLRRENQRLSQQVETPIDTTVAGAGTDVSDRRVYEQAAPTGVPQGRSFRNWRRPLQTRGQRETRGSTEDPTTEPTDNYSASSAPGDSRRTP